jgi:formamidopyrimidine-DNA glycosylase
MPELPEVETVRRLAEHTLLGRRIVAVATREDPLVYDGATPRRVAAALRGRQVTAVRRKGKHFWIELDRPPAVLFHLGMSGWLRTYREVRERPRSWKIEIEAEGGARLAMTDPRRLGRIRLRGEPLVEPPLARLGLDALDELPGVDGLARLLGRRRAPIKAVLLDQSVLAGVGNWLADEVLYRAAIDPRRPASSLARSDVGRLRSALAGIVKRAVDAGGDDARFPRTWLFHDRWGRKKDARTSRGERIVHLTVGRRTTAFVPDRQR